MTTDELEEQHAQAVFALELSEKRVKELTEEVARLRDRDHKRSDKMRDITDQVQALNRGLCCYWEY